MSKKQFLLTTLRNVPKILSALVKCKVESDDGVEIL